MAKAKKKVNKKKPAKQDSPEIQALQHVAYLGLEQAIKNLEEGYPEETPFEHLRKALDDVEIELSSMNTCGSCSGCESKNGCN